MDIGIGLVLGFNKIKTTTDEAIKPLEITQLTVFFHCFILIGVIRNTQCRTIVWQKGLRTT